MRIGGVRFEVGLESGLNRTAGDKRQLKRKGVAVIGLSIWLLAGTLGAQSHEGHHAPKHRYSRTLEKYAVPDVTLLNQDREDVDLRELTSQDMPVVLDFIFATCTTICPVMSAGLSGLQRELGDEAGQVHLVSISIDPEHDKPEVMKKYLQRYKAKPGWQFLTGSREDVEAVMRAFDSYVPDKMSHRPLTFLRGPMQEQWVRIDGLIGSADLLKEYRVLLEP